MIWLIDNGHGIESTRKESPNWPNTPKLYEWEFTRAIVKKLFPLCNERNIKYYNLLPLDNNLTNNERVELANNIGKYIKRMGMKSCFLSIHGNDNKETENAYGVEVHYFNHDSIAQVFQDEIVKQTGWADRGIKKSPFTVLKNTNMPAILTENGFYSNKRECKQMLTNEYVYKIALAHANAMQKLSV